MLKRLSTAFAILALTSFIGACSNTKSQSADLEKTPVKSTEIYEVHEDGRIYVFYDRKLYKEFLSLGETAYRLTRIGAGPKGETIVFGLTKKDKKKGTNTTAVQLYENKMSAGDNFYGETVRHGRIYVFSDFKDMATVRQFGHPNYFYTEIGSGPKGETVVYVLNKKTKKKKPVELIAKFQSIAKS